jgi:hypothetical protein
VLSVISIHVPVIKGPKYLIEVASDKADFFIQIFLDGKMASQDTDPSYLIKKSIDHDGVTVVFAIDSNNSI